MGIHAKPAKYLLGQAGRLADLLKPAKTNLKQTPPCAGLSRFFRGQKLANLVVTHDEQQS